MGAVKRCSQCAEEKELSGFALEKRARDGRVSACKTCLNARKKEYYRDNPGIKQEADKAYSTKHRERLLIKRAAFRESNRDVLRAGYRAHYYANKEARSKKSKEYAQQHPEQLKKAKRRWRAKNADKIKTYQKVYLSRHPERRKQTAFRYNDANRLTLRAKAKERGQTPEAKAYGREAVMRRNARKKNATPQWGNRFFMSEIYALAALRQKHLGIPFHVDHIVPLKSPLVCGLHWEGNLAVLPAVSNIQKGNRVWPDMPTPL